MPAISPADHPFDAASWTSKGTDALVSGDIIRIVDHPTVKDPSRKTARGAYLPVNGPDGRPLHGLRRTVGVVIGLSPSLAHPRAAVVEGMVEGFYREVYVEVVASEGRDALEPGATTSFLQHNAHCKARDVLRWDLSGPNWPASTTMRERKEHVAAFEETARSQRAAIDEWADLRAHVEELAAADGRKPKSIVAELAPDEVLLDERETSIWAGKVWNGQHALTVGLRERLVAVLERIRTSCEEAEAHLPDHEVPEDLAA